MLKFVLLLLFPVFSLAQVSVSAGMFAPSGTDAVGLALNVTATHTNERMAAGIKHTRATVRKVVYNHMQAFIGPRWGNLHVGLTFDMTLSSYQEFKNEAQGVGVRVAGYFPVLDRVGVVVEVNPGINGNGGRYAQVLVGGYYVFN